MKRSKQQKLLTVLALALVICMMPMTVFAAEADMRADVNGDGKVTSDDAIYLLRHVLMPEQYPILSGSGECQHTNTVIDEAKEPTCTETGLTEGKHCSECGEVLVAQVVVPAKGHNFVGGVCACGETQATPNSYFTFTLLSDGTYSIKAKNTNNMPANIVIPATYNGKAVTQIADWGFSTCSKLKSVTFGDNSPITKIDELGFYHCTNLETVIFGNNSKLKTIEDSAFVACEKLSDIKIPSTVTRIGRDAFSACKSLVSINIPKDTRIGETAFAGCTNLLNINVDSANTAYQTINGSLYSKNGKTLIQYALGKPDTSFTVPNNVTKIDDRAFSYSENLVHIKIPEGVTLIDYYAMANCTVLETVELPSSVQTINYSFYASTNIENFIVHSNNRYFQSINGSLYTKDGKSLIQYSTGKTDKIFTIPNSVTNILRHSFYGCSTLECIEIPNTVTSIEVSAFENCSSLKEIHIPDSVTTIIGNTFSGCTSLENVHIPTSVKSIGANAFKNCVNLKRIHIPDSVTSIGASAFENCTSLNEFYIPNNITSIGMYMLRNCTNLESILIPASTTKIDMGVCRGCPNIKNIYYGGTESEWTKITIDASNQELTTAIRYYYSETAPTTSGNWWHYVNGVPTIWDLTAHQHTEVIDAAKEATCTETGLTEGKHCSVCGEMLVAQTVVPAKGHTEVIDAAVAPTCTETGLTEGKHCSVCGEVLVAQEEIPAGHNYVNNICSACGNNIYHFAGGSGTESSPYLISTVNHLNNIRLYPSANYEIINDIQFTDQDYWGAFYNSGGYWKPIDDFTGTLDGNNYSVDGLKMNRSVSSETVNGATKWFTEFGLFSSTEGDISNLTLSNVNMQIYVIQSTYSSKTAYVGGIAGHSNGKIDNCTVSGTITVTGKTDYVRAIVGGIVGDTYTNASITNSCNKAAVKAVCTETTYSYSSYTYSSASYATVGGIVGDFEGKRLTDCVNYGSVSANSIRTPYAGGIMGENSHLNNIDSVQFSNCYNYGSVEAISNPPSKIDSSYSSYGYLYARAGGIVADLARISVVNCGNFADVTAKGWYTMVGGVIATAQNPNSDAHISQCFNKGNVLSYDANSSDYGSHYAGGITGTDGMIDQCYNTGSVTATGKDSVDVGGITAVTFSKISNCYNTGTISVPEGAIDPRAGGIIASCPSAIEYCYNVGTINGSQKAGIAVTVYDGTSNYDNERHITSCYYIDDGTSGVYEISDSCTITTYKKSASELKKQSTFKQFDFNGIWTVSNGEYSYPQLRNNPHNPME